MYTVFLPRLSNLIDVYKQSLKPNENIWSRIHDFYYRFLIISVNIGFNFSNFEYLRYIY